MPQTNENLTDCEVRSEFGLLNSRNLKAADIRRQINEMPGANSFRFHHYLMCFLVFQEDSPRNCDRKLKLTEVVLALSTKYQILTDVHKTNSSVNVLTFSEKYNVESDKCLSQIFTGD